MDERKDFKMVDITASMVKELRDKTGAGMMDSKKALQESNGDIEQAIDWLRQKGLASAAKKAGRIASEGLVGVVVDGKKAAIVEVNSETDFVSRNEMFQDFVTKAAKASLVANGDFETLKTTDIDGKPAADTLVDLVAKIGENMSMRRCASLEVSNGIVSSYMHSSIADGLGKIGVIVALESNKDEAELSALGKQLAMHIAASNPLFKSVEEVDADALEREKKIFSEQAKESGKPENIIEKMVEGRVRKYYEEVVLLEQTYIMDPDKKIKDVLGADVKLAGFVKFSLGEGIEKKEEDFAAEVAATAGLK